MKNGQLVDPAPFRGGLEDWPEPQVDLRELPFDHRLVEAGRKKSGFKSSVLDDGCEDSDQGMAFLAPLAEPRGGQDPPRNTRLLGRRPLERTCSQQPHLEPQDLQFQIGRFQQ